MALTEAGIHESAGKEFGTLFDPDAVISANWNGDEGILRLSMSNGEKLVFAGADAERLWRHLRVRSTASERVRRTHGTTSEGAGEA